MHTFWLTHVIRICWDAHCEVWEATDQQSLKDITVGSEYVTQSVSQGGGGIRVWVPARGAMVEGRDGGVVGSLRLVEHSLVLVDSFVVPARGCVGW